MPLRILYGSVVRRLQTGRRSCRSYSPHKVRPEDGGERQRTSNRSMRISAELEPEERNKPSSSKDIQDPVVQKQLVELTQIDLEK